jgi:hypothetical protein
MQDPATQPDLFKPEMPRIPGVNDESAAVPKSKDTKSLQQLLIVAVALCAIGLLVARGMIRAARNKVDAQIAAQSAVNEPLPAVATDEVLAAPAAPKGPVLVATLSELSRPWSSKAFTFTNPVTQEDVPAMVVRLPGSAGDRSSSYWAFSLTAPYESCELEYETDLNKLASRYSYRAGHPMVLAECDGTIYDPLRMATSPNGAWVRGEIVQGVGIRPPLAIEIQVQGNAIVAKSME